MGLFWCFNLPQVHMHKYITDIFPKQDCMVLFFDFLRCNYALALCTLGIQLGYPILNVSSYYYSLSKSKLLFIIDVPLKSGNFESIKKLLLHPTMQTIGSWNKSIAQQFRPIF